MSTIIFDIGLVEELNKLATEIDKRLYLFANYSPKQSLNITDEHKFWCGVTNLYGLFWDCAPFINKLQYTKKSLVDLFLEHRVLSRTDAKTFRFFLGHVSSLRSFFCHNCADDNYFSRRDQEKVERLFIRLCGIYPCDMERRETLGGDSHWKRALIWLTEEANKCIGILEKALCEVKVSANRQVIIHGWLEAVAEWYKDNDSLLNSVLYDKYNLMSLIRFPQGGRRFSDARQDAGQNVKMWKRLKIGEQTNEELWKRRCLTIVLSMDKPALPCEVMKINISQSELKLL